MSGDGASERNEENTEFWAVATPLRAAWQPPNAFGAGGRYRPTSPADFLAPSPAELSEKQSESLNHVSNRRAEYGPDSKGRTQARKEGSLSASRRGGAHNAPTVCGLPRRRDA